MPKISGLFDLFSQAESIPVEKISQWLKNPPDPKLLENLLANRILYPQAVAVSLEEYNLDLAILKEALKLYQKDYCNLNLKKIFIPSELQRFFPSLKEMVVSWIEGLKPHGIFSLVLINTSLGEKTIGSVITPEIENPGGWVEVSVRERKYHVKNGAFFIIEDQNNKVDIKFESQYAKLMGQNTLVTEVSGGEFGLLIDTR